MKTRQLGNTDMQITPIGFGSWAVGGGGYQFGWGPQDDEQSIAAINHALALGINWIDTAAVYGLGHAEEIVARALKIDQSVLTSSRNVDAYGMIVARSPVV